MKLIAKMGAAALMCAGVVALSSCGGPGSSGTPSPQPTPAADYAIGGTVSGLFGAKSQITLENNGGDATTVTGNGAFVFAKKIQGGDDYKVTISSEPANPPQTCTVSGGSGTAMGDVTSVTVNCAAPASYTVGGTVTGLVAGTNGVILQDKVNGSAADSVTVDANGSFAFATSVMASDIFAVTVETQPDLPIQNCTVMNGTGTVSGDVGSVTVSCAAPPVYSIGGTIVDLTGSSLGLVLQDNGGDTFTPTASGAFTFATTVEGGEPYSVEISQQPTTPAQKCSVSNGVGKATGNVSNVVIDCGHDKWTWVGGSQTAGAGAVYGTMGVAAAGNTPGSRQSPVTWTDVFGNFWIFGGWGYDSHGMIGPLNDVWRYNNGQWTWMGGSNLSSSSGVYGTVGVAAPGNVPSGRNIAASWVAANGDVWVFGGSGVDSTGTGGFLSDLWKYSQGEWTWMNGPDVVNQIGNNAGEGVTSPINVPSARSGAYSWIDAAGNLWMFGGTGQDAGGQFQQNDMWEYSQGEWTWVSGTNLSNKPGIYGTQGVANSTNLPGARGYGNSWADADGNFWLFGGIGYDQNVTRGQLNDLWKYSNGQWTWMAGSAVQAQLGSYGVMGVASANNVLSARMYGLTWKDRQGNFWVLGGFGIARDGSLEYLNDFWEYSNGGWIWMGGTQNANSAGVYGAGTELVPGARESAATWVDANGNLWMWGGYGYGVSGAADELSDMWEYRF